MGYQKGTARSAARHARRTHKTSEQARARLDNPDTDRDSARRTWRDAAAAFQAAVTEYAADGGEARYEVEMAAKKVVRHPEA